MNQIVQTGPEVVEVQESEQPSPGPDEVLVRVHSAGLCGSDAHAYTYEGGYEWVPIPRVMGHEYSGEIAALGANVTAHEVGDRVIEEPIHHCGECFQCKNGQENVCQNFSITGMHRDGAYADYITVDPAHLHPVPDAVDLDHAAITEPTSIATRAVFSRSAVTPGDEVLVEGPGPIGSLVALIADSMGANVLVSGLEADSRSRLPRLERAGLDTVDITDESLEDHATARTETGFDVTFDTTGHHTGVENAIEVTRKGGQIVSVGLPADTSEVYMTPLVRGEIDVSTSYGSTWTNFEQALRLLENGTIDAEDIVEPFSTTDPSVAFEAFLNAEVIKPVFSFADGEAI